MIRLTIIVVIGTLLAGCSSKPTAPTSSKANLELQRICAKQAEEFLDYQESHFNTKLNKCFVLTSGIASGVVAGKSYITGTRMLYDAFENRMYALYVWHDAEYLSFGCEIPLPSGELKSCLSEIPGESERAFDAAVKEYMNEEAPLAPKKLGR